MKIVINTQSHIIPIEINGKQFEFDTSDDNLKMIAEKYIEVAKEIESLKNDDEKLTAALRETIDVMLGNGAYDEIYSTVKATRYMVQIYGTLMEEVHKQTSQLQKNIDDRTKRFKKKLK